MLSRNKVCFHPEECCCSHFPVEVWILTQCVRATHIIGKCLGSFNVLLDIEGFVSNSHQPPALFKPACGLNCTTLLQERQEAPAKQLCSSAGWCSLCLPLLLPALDVDGQRFALIPNSLWEEKTWTLVKIIGKCKGSWVIGTLVYTSQQQAME